MRLDNAVWVQGGANRGRKEKRRDVAGCTGQNQPLLVAEGVGGKQRRDMWP